MLTASYGHAYGEAELKPALLRHRHSPVGREVGAAAPSSATAPPASGCCGQKVAAKRTGIRPGSLARKLTANALAETPCPDGEGQVSPLTAKAFTDAEG